MATSWLRPLHINKGKTIAQTITDRTNYADNPDKTRQGELVTGYECNPRTVDTEFLLSKKEYFAKTGRTQKNDVLAYHLMQAFKPGEITPEEANRIGHELALRFTKGQHAFIVATHIDKAHIHNHVIFNSTNLDCNRKFVNFKNSSFAVRKLNDLICLENGLSVIDDPKPSKGHYGDWLGDKKEPTVRERLEEVIEKVLSKEPTSFEGFIKLLEAENCEFKHNRRSVRLAGQKGFIRLNSLSDSYTEDVIRKRINCKYTAPSKEMSSKSKTTKTQKYSLIIDIQNSIKAKNSPAYERWSKIFNLKQAAKALMFLQDNNLDDVEKLNEVAQEAKDKFNGIQTRIHAIDARLHEISQLQKHIGTYIKTKGVYAEYKGRKFNKKFFVENEKAIADCKAAKEYFDEKNLTKLPTIKTLKQEYATLIAEKKKLYSGHNTARTYMQEILMAKQNVQMILNCQDTEQDIKKDHEIR